MITDAINLTRELISFNTINPPGNEGVLAKYIGSLLEENGFKVEYPVFENDRLHLIAEKGLSLSSDPVILSGHLDTVPLGNNQWNFPPLKGEIKEGKLYGRGSSDMKAGLAVIILASISAFEEGNPPGGVRIIFTSGEELGCQGIKQLSGILKNPGRAKALIVGEPTSNIPVTGHKGGLYLKVSFTGVTSHSSMPWLGVNAIYKAAHAITKIERFDFNVPEDSLLGYPTVNVGTVKGGLNLNSVPDYTEFTMDIRTTRNVNHQELIKRLEGVFGEGVRIEILTDLSPVFTEETDPFVRFVYDVCEVDPFQRGFPKALSYLTDASVLQKIYKDVPTIVLGPGQPEMAHQTDEFCYLSKIEEALIIYKKIILNWNK